MRLLSAIILLFSQALIADEMADTFLVKIYDRRVKVLSPSKKSEKLSVILENKTLSKIYGKVISNYRVLKHVVIEPELTVSVPLKIENYENLSFIPLAPAFQEIELIVGRKSYEIPSKE